MLSSEYTEEELANLSLVDVMSDMDGLTNTATDDEVGDMLDDIWGSDGDKPEPGEQVKRLCDEFAEALRGKYSEEELKNMSLDDIIGDIDAGNTATNDEVADAINDVWGPEEP